MSGFSGIESKFNAPFDTKLHVDNLAAAVASDTDYNFPNMVIFVKNEKAFYYLKDGALGNATNHWQKMGDSSAMFNPWVATKIYAVGETAAVGTNMFICIATTAVGESPTTHPAKWLAVGATSKFTQSYTNQTTFTVTHSIPNATCHVYDSTSGVEMGVLITRVSPTQFRVESNQNTSGLIIIE